MGAGKHERVRELYRKILFLTVTVGLAFTLLFELAPDAILGMFGIPKNIPNPEEYWTFGEKTMRIFLSLVSVCCVVKMNSIFFQAVGKPVFAAISSTVRDVFFFTPLLFVLPAIRPSVELLLYAAPIADVLSLAVTAGLTIAFLRSLEKSPTDKVG
jgi:Na+-driven multidrug efflux pump